MKRNYGLDLLRIVSMLMIITLHYLGKGGALYHSSGIYLYISYAIEALCFVSVNTFVLVSGYFLIDDNRVKIKKIINYLIQLWVINFVISLIILVSKYCDFKFVDYFNMFFPFFSKNNWFINCYIFLYLLHPYINKIINNCSKREYQILLLVILFLMSVIPTLTANSAYLYDLSRGYSISWFVTLYLISGYIKRYNAFDRDNYEYIFLYLVCCSILPIYKYIVTTLNLNSILSFELVANNMYNYSSIPVLLASICLFMIFKNINIKNKLFIKLIEFNVPLLLGVYLIHEQIMLRRILWIDLLHANNYYDKPSMLLNLVIEVFGLFIFCSLAEFIRIKLFTFRRKEVK